MGLGDTLGALPPECGGTGRTSPGMVACGASVSGNGFAVSLPSGMTMDGFSLFVGLGVKTNYADAIRTVAPVIVPVSAIEGGLSIEYVQQYQDIRGGSVTIQFAKDSDSGFTATTFSTNSLFMPANAGTWYAL